MATQTIPAFQAQVVPDKLMLRARLEEARASFHRLLDSARGDRWYAKDPGSDWTVGEVLEHLTWALEQLPQEVKMARQGKGMFNMPKWIANPGSYWLNRWSARKSDPASLHRRYDAAMDATLAALDTVPDSDWTLGAQFYGERFYTVADLFATPGDHLAQHTKHL